MWTVQACRLLLKRPKRHITVSPSLVQTTWADWSIVFLNVVHLVFFSTLACTHLLYDRITVSTLSHISPNRLKNVAQSSDLLCRYRPSLSPNCLSPCHADDDIMILVIKTRKLSWRKEKCLTVVHVWRPLTKKSTTNQPYTILYWWLIATCYLACYLYCCEIFSRIEAENCHFCPLYCDCRV